MSQHLISSVSVPKDMADHLKELSKRYATRISNVVRSAVRYAFEHDPSFFQSIRVEIDLNEYLAQQVSTEARIKKVEPAEIVREAVRLYLEHLDSWLIPKRQ